MHTAHKLPHQRALITHVTAGRCVHRPCVVTCLLVLMNYAMFELQAAAAAAADGSDGSSSPVIIPDDSQEGASSGAADQSQPSAALADLAVQILLNASTLNLQTRRVWRAHALKDLA